jgi:hypothetical protein
MAPPFNFLTEELKNSPPPTERGGMEVGQLSFYGRSRQLLLYQPRNKTRSNRQCLVARIVAWVVERPVGIANARC